MRMRPTKPTIGLPTAVPNDKYHTRPHGPGPDSSRTTGRETGVTHAPPRIFATSTTRTRLNRTNLLVRSRA